MRVFNVFTGVHGIASLINFNNLARFPKVAERIFMITPKALTKLNANVVLLQILNKSLEESRIFDINVLLEHGFDGIEFPTPKGKLFYCISLNTSEDKKVLNRAMLDMQGTKEGVKLFMKIFDIEVEGEHLLTSPEDWKKFDRVLHLKIMLAYPQISKIVIFEPKQNGLKLPASEFISASKEDFKLTPFPFDSTTGLDRRIADSSVFADIENSVVWNLDTGTLKIPLDLLRTEGFDKVFYDLMLSKGPEDTPKVGYDS